MDNTNTQTGKLKFFHHNWSRITNDPVVLSCVYGLQITISNNKSQPISYPQNTPKSGVDKPLITKEINILLNIGVTSVSEPCDGQFLPSYFKLENYRTAMRLVSKNCYMCSIDLKDAYFTINVHNDSRKFLRFCWLGKLYDFKFCHFLNYTRISSIIRFYSKPKKEC